jgi:arsenite methyltransferase
MLKQAYLNSDKKGFKNVEFRYGDIENLPLLDNFVDCVISNCVINLCPDKKKAYSEIFRVLKSKGHFSISDVILKGI